MPTVIDFEKEQRRVIKIKLTDMAEIKDSRISRGSNEVLNSCGDNSCQLLPAENGQITDAICLFSEPVVQRSTIGFFITSGN